MTTIFCNFAYALVCALNPMAQKSTTKKTQAKKVIWIVPKSPILLYIIIAIAVMCSEGCVKTDPNKKLLNELDDAIENREAYHQQKEETLSEIKQEIVEAVSQEDRFHAMGHLLDEYKSYNTDSALVICQKRLALAEDANIAHLKIHAKLSIADVLSLMGLYKETTDIIQSYPRDSVPDYLLAYYYHINRTVYGFMSDYTVIESEKDRYSRLTREYRDSLMQTNEPGSLYYVLTECDQMNVSGEADKAAKLLERYIDAHSFSDHERAILSYTLSESYRLLGDRDNEKKQLIISAINDMKTGVNEYISLKKLALMLYDEGDVNRAYNYLKICMEDAKECNARLRIIEINDIFPIVNDVYLDTISVQQHRLRWGIALVGLLAILLIVMIFFIYKEKKKVDVARQYENEANSKLSALNDELRKANDSLILANNSIKENSCLKEEFITQYMGQCAMYIEKIDHYQKALSRIEATKQYNELKKILKTLPTSDAEARAFYDNFDDTFLKLFPTFVRDFNALLKPEEQLEPKISGKLNTELRIFALIRLGINDSVRIAQFLRYSPTTIYNYRTRVRNRAKGDRDKLEEDLLKIGKFD